MANSLDNCSIVKCRFYFHYLLYSTADLEQMVLCMPHRGRLIVQVGLLELSATLVFRKMSGLPEFPATNKECVGDILTHLCKYYRENEDYNIVLPVVQ